MTVRNFEPLRFLLVDRDHAGRCLAEVESLMTGGRSWNPDLAAHGATPTAVVTAA